jgi:hypothetical protein
LAENWKKPEEDNMSIGELAEWLQALPNSLQHLPVTTVCGSVVISLHPRRFSFTDGERYFSDKVLEGMKTFNGISLEIDANPNL